MIFKDYYATLGILPQSTQEEISYAYRIMAKKWHPDTNKDVDTTWQMQRVTEAYFVLKNSEKRRAYDIEYFKLKQVKNDAQIRKEVKIERCYYCSINISQKGFTYKETYYKETKRTHFPRKVWFQTTTVQVPRCESCYKIHNSNSKIFIILPLFSFTLLGLILGLTILSMWLLCLIAGGFVGLILGGILSSIDSSLIAKEAGIKKESDLSEYEAVSFLYKNGWTKNEPTA